MKPIPKIFEFTSYDLDIKKSRAVFNYRIEFTNQEALEFVEVISFPKPFLVKDVPIDLLENLLTSVHIMLGISYYKLYCPPKIRISTLLSEDQADFWNIVYRKGLGEFFYRNKIDPRNLIKFPFSKKVKPVVSKFSRKNRSLVGVGGGKDSIVAIEILKKQTADITALVIETQKKSSISSNVIAKMQLESLVIERHLDEKIFQSFEGAYNGHIPISAVFAFLGYFAAIIYDYSYVIVANEHSSNFGNVNYKGEEINHQWSKSSEFEMLFQEYTRKNICPDAIYFSLLRPFNEIRIVEMFTAYKKYASIFTSCNRSFRVHKDRPDRLWCGECPKCAFMFIMLSAFLNKNEVVEIFQKNMYEDEKLLPLFLDILGYGKMKPFDCVGTFDEARAALFMAKDKFGDCVVMRKVIGRIKNPTELIDAVFKTNEAAAMPDKFKFLGIKNVLILGYGKEGIVTEKYLKKYFPNIKIGIADEKNGPSYLENQENYDLVVKTPGIPKKMVTIPYTTATNIFFSQVKNVTIGVTGSKGKSTTASLIHSILKSAGKKVRLLGNIGSPMLEVLLQPIDQDEIFIIELSSYQLEDIKYSPQISVVLNLFPEHMNYHGNIEKYYVAKKNIIKFQNDWDHFVFNGKDKELKKWRGDANAKKIAFNKIDLENIKISLLGRHNEDNVRAAVAVANILNIPKKEIREGVEKFQSLSHRLEFAGTFEGINFYDDAISTTPESTIAAIDALKNVDTIFLGGLDRGYDFLKLAIAINKSKIRNIVFFPDSGEKVEKALRKNSKKKYLTFHTKNMEDAVNFAFKNTKVGGICLLSTASPSYSVWKNFEEKGGKFKEAVKKLK
ncbi:MAG TPA: UDP-N-acetylmuramoyl-L-alanine--D-glutamate ligase [Candidatus Moranbacteria bacterium]|nr:UDP-N-acetylmuramoyl-L-alanine--D-glutamate ligase [Candidatus Moranbacteria bacterium]